MRLLLIYLLFQSILYRGIFIEWKIYQSVAAELFAHDLERLCWEC